MRIGIFGGTFNPIHYGHLRAAEEVKEAQRLKKIIFIPSGIPPLKSSELISPAHRYAMTSIAVSGNPDFKVSDIECKRDRVSYSLDTVKKLKQIYSRDKLFFILGVEAFVDLPRWRGTDELISLADFIVISRPPYSLDDALQSPYLKDKKKGIKMNKGQGLARAGLKCGRSVVFVTVTSIAISSTMIRDRLREGRTIKYLLPEKVESYIISNRLYTAC